MLKDSYQLEFVEFMSASDILATFYVLFPIKHGYSSKSVWSSSKTGWNCLWEGIVFNDIGDNKLRGAIRGLIPSRNLKSPQETSSSYQLSFETGKIFPRTCSSIDPLCHITIDQEKTFIRELLLLLQFFFCLVLSSRSKCQLTGVITSIKWLKMKIM